MYGSIGGDRFMGHWRNSQGLNFFGRQYPVIYADFVHQPDEPSVVAIVLACY